MYDRNREWSLNVTYANNMLLISKSLQNCIGVHSLLLIIPSIWFCKKKPGNNKKKDVLSYNKHFLIFKT